MIKIITIIGARPQIIKAAAIIRAIRNKFSDQISEIIVHTGQHYDRNMSKIFFDELEIPKPDYNLNIGSASHGKQTALMIEGIEKILLTEKPHSIILYGDTNSTLAGAVAAAKIHIPVFHIEAGLRSFNKKMPEEINRIVCDHASTLLFSPTLTGFNNLIREGFDPDTKPPYNIDNPGIYHCGDVMFDNSIYFSEVAEKKSGILKQLNLSPGKFILTTIHRDNNTDNPERLNAIFSALKNIAENQNINIVLPIHPRTSKLLKNNLSTGLYKAIKNNPLIKTISPVSFLDMIVLEKNTEMIFTDSGGVQKEAYFFQKPCIIMRSETEWKEIVENKAAIVTDADETRILNAYEHFKKSNKILFPPIFGNGKASEFICEEIIKNSRT
ncbi:MAG: UDP-N-acetylglucosamine 2-epimerase (non-hydrolyzing) [Bacteroidales bacterium]|nr:UDP-N-acetylglucosamine 2-epimerase (non-hydrolyzing) [Bacteroidales bacterium]